MQSLFKQTRTRVHTPQAQQRERERGLLSAARSCAAIQLGTQLLLWIFFYGYDQAQQAVWQSALMLLLPLGALWLVWKSAAVDHPAGKWWMLPLLLCLLADAALMVTALGGFVSQLVPNDPAWVPGLLSVGICYLAALRSRERGVKYGSAVMAVPLVVLLLFGTVFLRASTRSDRMWPILGDGLLSTAQSALGGIGAVWSVSILFALPRSPKVLWKSCGWAVVPWALCTVCAVWFGFVRPWAAGDDLAISEKMMGLARHAHSVILYEMSGILWMLLIPTSLIACFSTGGELLTRAFPRMPLWAALLPVPALACTAALAFPENIFGLLGTALPWRWVISLICGLGLVIAGRRQK